jgi:2-polyprenyl-3-methyl-5-hydroxy-6-metoxy-1,4-benzoquinol methylase
VSRLNPIGSSYEAYVDSQRVDSLHLRYLATLERLTSLLAMTSTRNNLLYDVGAGSGAFLVEARAFGFDVSGNDISEAAIRMCFVMHGIQLSNKELRDEGGQDRFDAMTMWCVLAHVWDPRALLADTFRLLKPGGVLYFHTPRWCLIDSIGLVAYRLTRGKLDHILERRINRAHRRLYERSSLIHLLRSVGFEIVDVSPKSGYSLKTTAYLEGMRVPRILRRPISAGFDGLIDKGLVPRNVLDVYVRKPAFRSASPS